MKDVKFKYLNVPSIKSCCPVCECKTGNLLYTVTAKEAAQHFVLKESHEDRNIKLENHIVKLWGQSTCDLVSCGSCGFVFANPYIAGDSIFYSLAYERSGYPKWKWEYETTKKKITKIVSNAKQESLRLLEIGAGNGAFVRNISPEIIPKKNILCLEYSEYGKKKITDFGIKCLDSDVRNLESEFSESFDFILMFQVLEHMDNLDALFKKLNSLASAKAHLFIAVPNPKRIIFNEHNGLLLDMPPNHIGRWSLSNFKVICKKYGWTLEDHLVEPQSFIDTFKQHIAYRYLKISQDSESYANLVERLQNNKVRKIVRVFLAGIYMLANIKSFIQAVSKMELGDSQLVYLKRN